MSVLSYNGVYLPYSFTTGFRQEAVYDDMSGTDWILTRFDIQIQCVVNADYATQLAPELVGIQTRSAADVMNIIRSRLLKPRKRLSFKFNGVELIPQPQEGIGSPGDVDARNGPQPQSCILIELTNTTFYMVYHIVAHYWEHNRIDAPDVVNQDGNNILYNRWSETVEIDNCNYSRKTREGKFMIRSDNREGYIADQLRSQFAVVSIPPGFLRDSSSYTVSPDGLAIQYRIVDREVFKKPPSPAYEASGDYVETGTRADALRFGEVNVRLKGHKAAPGSAVEDSNATMAAQEALLIAAITLATSKLRSAGAPVVGPFKAIIESSMCRVNLFENEVEVRIRVMKTPTPKSLLKTPFYGRMVYTPISDDSPHYLPTYQDRGSASLLLQAAKYYDPSIAENELGFDLLTTTNRETDFAGDLSTRRVQMKEGLKVGKAGIQAEG